MIRRGLEWFGGSVLVYVLVAACSAADIPEKMMSMGDGDGDSSSGDGDVAAGDGDSLGTGAGPAGDGDQKPMGDGDGDMMAQGDGGQAMGDDNSGASSMGDGNGGTGGMMGMIMDPVPDADAAEDGSRIVNLYRTTPGGLKTHEGYWDAELGAQCYFQLASDGKTRCLPNVPTATIATYFSDSGCTQQVAYTTKGLCVVQAVKSVQFDGGCDTPTRYSQERYNLGAKVTTLYRGSPESCSDATDALETIDAYALDSPIDPSAYVEGALVPGGD